MNNNEVKVTLRMPREIRERIAEMADREHRSMGGQIVAILDRAVNDYLQQRKELVPQIK